MALSLQEQLDRLKEIRRSGILVMVQSDGRRIEYKSDAEIATAIGELEQAIAGSSSTNSAKVSYARFQSS